MILGALQARASSTRLPGKVLKPILGEPMLARQIERLRRATRIERLVVSTSTDASDDDVERMCANINVDCQRGSLDDVLDRLYRTVEAYAPDHVVRLTGDCPLADPAVIDALIEFHLDGDYDYSSNTITPTWPDGLDAEICRFAVFEAAWSEATAEAEREHVTPFIYNRPERFNLGDFRSDTNLSDLRWTVDEPADFKFVEQVYAALYPTNAAFATADILALLERAPELATLNAGFTRNEGTGGTLRTAMAGKP